MEEVWKDVVGYERLYMVSDMGRIKGLGRYVWNGNTFVFKPEKIITSCNRGLGYHVVGLYLNGERTTLQVHRLVAIAFIPNPYNKEMINHKDGKRSNNKLENLEWCTRSENMIHAFYVLKSINLTPPKYNGSNDLKVLQLSLIGSKIKLWASIKDASIDLKIASSSISKCCKNTRNHAGKFKWEYA